MDPSPAEDQSPAAAAAARFAAALEHYRGGDHDAAGRLLDEALRQEPGNPLLWNLAGAVAKAQGQAARAERCWRRAIALAPDQIEAHYNLGVLLQQAGRSDEAIGAYRGVLALAPRHVQALNNLGGALERQGQAQQALACYEQASAADPVHAKVHHNRGRMLGALGRFDQAQQAFAAALGAVPVQQRAAHYQGLASVKRFAAGDADLAAMERLAQEQPALPPEQALQLHFALAKAYGDLGQRQRAFDHLLTGNRLKRALTPYKEAATLERLDRTTDRYPAALVAFFSGWRENGRPPTFIEAPIFILGMPRSGSSLVEQILASHPQLHGAGECQEFARLAEALERRRKGDPRVLLDQLGRDYCEALRARTPPARRWIDKNLGNFRYAGLIQMALPAARIIHIRRDAADTCLSCFEQLFDGDHPYAYDLAELGRYWRAYDRLMRHWAQVLPPGVMIEVDYEELVADVEGQTRRLLAHCGLPWDERCLAFQRTERAVLTASASQVRQPVYRSAVGKARAHGEALRPLLDALAG